MASMPMKAADLLIANGIDMVLTKKMQDQSHTAVEGLHPHVAVETEDAAFRSPYCCRDTPCRPQIPINRPPTKTIGLHRHLCNHGATATPASFKD
jgi:hypothetical protein